ncbi:hypothetical protein [Streptomyces sp. NRRL B-24085]|uniref:hypothetical protein n=1 Tax=Streptomyces sp. NRRL B-24085 TaxID=1709476 RepID=UPI00131C80BC|nr:hypothetical protein [Streptomyces sp. NRRL B-24085]
MLRVFAALCLSLTPLAVSGSANAVPAAAAMQTFPLFYAIGQIPLAEESRAGYTRDK